MSARLDAPASEAAAATSAQILHKRACAECAVFYSTASATSAFCGNPCRKAWNNRRLIRGAELYDLFMAHRFSRPLAYRLKLWSLICRMAAQFRKEDVAQRAGRPSWRDPRVIIAQRPYLSANVIAGKK